MKFTEEKKRRVGIVLVGFMLVLLVFALVDFISFDISFLDLLGLGEDEDVEVMLAPGDCPDVNEDGVINIEDLTLVVFWQGKDSFDSDWDDFSYLDVNEDNEVDSEDVDLVIEHFSEECSGSPEPDDSLWEISFEAPTIDSNGKELGGTEARTLVAFDGKLFAGNNYWMDTRLEGEFPEPENCPNAQIFVLDSSSGEWEEELTFVDRVPIQGEYYNWPQHLAISVMKPITFTTDYAGHVLINQKSFLLASTWDAANGVQLFIREEGDVDWVNSVILPPDAEVVDGTHIRSFGFHQDSETHIDLVFAGVGMNKGIFKGAYVSSTGNIVWDDQTEITDVTPGIYDRVTSFTEANEKLYATICGKIYERQDETSSWNLVFKYDYERCDGPGSGEVGFRGATTIPNPDGTGEVILLALEGDDPMIGRFDPVTQEVVVELDVNNFLSEEWGLGQNGVAYCIMAYNDMTEFTMPSGDDVLLIGLEAWVGTSYSRNWNMWHSDGWVLVRYEDATYELKQVVDDSNPDKNLVATRTIIKSPFAGEEDVLYVGGWDANSHECRDTAWIYKGGFE